MANTILHRSLNETILKYNRIYRRYYKREGFFQRVLEEQGAFRKRRSCMDQLLTVRMLIEKTIAKNKRMIMVGVDLEKAYDM